MLRNLETTGNRYSPFPTSADSKRLFDRIISLREAFARDQISGRDLVRFVHKTVGFGTKDQARLMFQITCADPRTDPRTSDDVADEQFTTITKYPTGEIVLGEDSRG